MSEYDNIAKKLGDAQGKMITAQVQGNKEREEHYRELAEKLTKQLTNIQ